MASGEKTGGRTAGTPNKLSSKTKDAIWEVFHGLGDTEEMLAWAKDNKGDFYTKIWPRLIPMEIHGKGFTPPKTNTKEESAADFARKLLYCLNEGLYDLKNAELLREMEIAQHSKPN